MKWLFGKTMLGAAIGAATLLFTHGVSPDTIGTAVSILLTAAGVRHAVDKGPTHTL